MKKLIVVVVLVLVVAAGAYCYMSGKDEPVPTMPPPTNSNTEKIVSSLEVSIDWMKKAQNPDGGWGVIGMPDSDPGITGLVLKSLAINNIKLQGNPWMSKAVDYLVSKQHEDGSIFVQSLQSYVTAISISALVQLDSKKYADVIEKAKNYLLSIQFKAGDGRTEKDWYVGGITYNDEKKPPNLSTTVFALEALREAGVSKDSEVFKNAAKFVTRCQNRSESNDMPLDVLLTNDGGFFYAPGDTRGEKVEGEGGNTLRSYGSMTYAGLLSLVYCNVSTTDPRITSAINWMQDNYTFDYNPGMPKKFQGIYYYLMTCAKMLDVANIKVFPKGQNVAEDLEKKIMSLRKPDGSWVNENEERWYEGNPVLATAYMLTALGHLNNLSAK